MNQKERDEIQFQNDMIKQFLQGLKSYMNFPSGFNFFIGDHHGEFQIKKGCGDATPYQSPDFKKKLIYFLKISKNENLIDEVRTFDNFKL